MLFDFCEGIGQSLPSMFLPLRDGNTLHRINTVDQPFAFRFREHSRKCHLDVLVGSVSQLTTMLPSYLLHEVLPIDCSEVTNTNSEIFHEDAVFYDPKRRCISWS